jgi:hypothetical protein
MDDSFTLRNRAMRLWLGTLLVCVASIAVVFPPAFWLCGIGCVMIVTASIANSARTDQWYSWQNEGSLSWFEGWAATTGAVMLVVPLLFIVVRSRMS